jgi:excisionase family DNA binding protein
MSDARIELLTEHEAAAFLRLKPQTLRVWRCAGRYEIPFAKIGRAVRYRRADLERWVAVQLVGTSDTAGASP